MRDVRSLHEGELVTVWEREGTLDHWNRFAAANHEFAGHHMDDAVAQAEGFDRAFIMAPMSHAYLHCMLREWAGDDPTVRILSVDMRLKNPLLRGRVLSAGGTVTATRREGHMDVVELDIWQRDDEGTVLGLGTASLGWFTSPESEVEGSGDSA